MPGQRAQDAESCLTVWGVATKPECPLSFQVGEDKGEVLDLGDNSWAREGELGDRLQPVHLLFLVGGGEAVQNPGLGCLW